MSEMVYTSSKNNKVQSAPTGGIQFGSMTPAQKSKLFEEITRKKKQAQIIFYDYVADK